MSKQAICTVHDIKAQAYRPVNAPTVGTAEREFIRQINEAHKENPLYMWPEDYDLYLVGNFDTETGMIESCEKVQLATGYDIGRIRDAQNKNKP